LLKQAEESYLAYDLSLGYADV
jgi:hypothetical protein